MRLLPGLIAAIVAYFTLPLLFWLGFSLRFLAFLAIYLIVAVVADHALENHAKRESGPVFECGFLRRIAGGNMRFRRPTIRVCRFAQRFSERRSLVSLTITSACRFFLRAQATSAPCMFRTAS